MPYQTIDHTADIGIVVQADSVEGLFKESARALSELIFGGRVFAATAKIALAVKGDDWPDLMINWLRELLYLWNGNGQIIGPVQIHKIKPFTVTATIRVENTPCNPQDVCNEIKAVTYHMVAAANTDDGWQARIIFDI